MSEKKNPVIIPELVEPVRPHPGGDLWREITKAWGEKNRGPLPVNERESEIERSARRIRETRERIRGPRSRRTDPVSGEIKNQASPLLGQDLENHFRRLLNLGAELVEGKIREALGTKKKK